MNSPKISLMITTDEFGFTNAEVGFIRKNFQRKYPAVMGDFIDHARNLMKAIQITSKIKLVYSAMRYFPENSTRYHISEELIGFNEENKRMFVSLRPVETNRKALFGANSKLPSVDGDVEQLLEDLAGLLGSPGDTVTAAQTYTELPMTFVIGQIYEFLKLVKSEVVVQNFSLDISKTATSTLTMDLSHKASRSHYLQLCFDFVLPKPTA